MMDNLKSQGAALQASALSGEIKPYSEVDSQLNILDRQVAELLDRIGILEGRLTPVLRPVGCSDCADKAMPEDPLSPVAAVVRDQGKRVGYAMARIETLLGTLAV
jgi:hypothetical protein